MDTLITTGAPTWTWAIPLIVGIIALAGVSATAFISHHNMRMQIRSAHKLKIAEMRQAWINNLRDAMAAFQSYGVTPEIAHGSMREFYEMGTKIELFMNPHDPDYVELQGCLHQFLSAETKLKNLVATLRSSMFVSAFSSASGTS